jgi:voltage-gated sodium channel
MAKTSDREQSRLFVPMSDDIESYRVKPIAKIVYGNVFEVSIVFLILLNAIALAVLTFSGIPSSLRDTLEVVDDIIIWFFVCEIVLRILSYGRKPWMFFTSGWNIFDFLIIALVPFFSGATIILRLLRLLRVVRLFRFLPDFRMLSSSIAKTLKPLGSLTLLIGFFMFIYAMAGVYFFGEKNPTEWGDLGLAFVTLTVLLTLENFPDVLEAGLDVSPFAWLFFVSFMFLVVFTVLNVLIGIVLNAMDEARDEEKTDDTPDEKKSEVLLVTELEAIAGKRGLSASTKQKLRKLL